MNCREKLQALGLSDAASSAALHYLADHLAHHLHPSPQALPLFQQAFRCGIRAACDQLRTDAGDTVSTVDFHPLTTQASHNLLTAANA